MATTNKIILGTVQFGLKYGINNAGDKPAVQECEETLKYAYENGIKILDTADAYGNASEIIGDFHAKVPYKFLVNTKFSVGSDFDIQKQAEKSLGLLNIDFINVYFYHNFKNFVEHPEVIPALQELKQKGLIRKIGISVYDNVEFEAAINSNDIDAIQLPFNMLDNVCQRGVLLKLAKQRGKEIQVRSVFLQGLFLKPLAQYPSYLEPLKPYVQELQEVAAQSELEMDELAMLYAEAQNEIDNIVIGVDNIHQLQKNLSFNNSKLSADTRKSIDNISVQETALLYPSNWK